MSRINLPNPIQVEVIKRFLTESCKMWVEGVKFAKEASGLSMAVTFRDFEDNTHTKKMMSPNITDFEEMTLVMSDYLDEVSGVSLALMERKKARLAHA